MDFDSRTEPRLAEPAGPRMGSALDRLKNQLVALVAGQQTMPRLTELARDRLETARDDLSREDARKLDCWIDERSDVAGGEARIKWRYLRVVFASI